MEVAVKRNWIKLHVLSELTDTFEETDVLVNQIQTVTDPKVQGRHILSTIRLKGGKRELLVRECAEEIHLRMEFAHLEWHKLPFEFWERMKAIIDDPALNIDHEGRIACDSSELHSIEVVMTQLAELTKGEVK